MTLVLAVFSVGVLTGQEAAQEVRPPHDFATVTVRLHNATAGGTDVAGDSVTLTLYANGRPVDARQAKADAEGAAVFENVVTGDGLVAAVHARHGDMSFSSGEPVVLEAGKKKFETTVHVYEVSEDNSQLKVGAHQFILRAEGSRLVVTEIMQLINPTDRAISSATKDADGKPQVIRINLPAGWGNFYAAEYFVTEALVFGDDGFYDTMAIPPGTHEAVFGYEIPISGETLEIRKTMSMPVADFTVFSQLPPGSVQGLGPATAMADFNAEHYPTAAYDAGQTLEFKVVGFTAEYSDARDIVILSGVFAVVVLLGVYRLVKGGSRQPAAAAVSNAHDNAEID